ncbi:MAG: cytochrome c-type biogenesis protein CcmH [Alphaproteobacteria bacterium]|nr:cytochrome c-type biogenesis protein CcmH [Alphaproteobacteria bacterium]
MKRLAIILILLASPLWAVLPDEILPDAELEARARDISKGLRCLVCRNENIDDSNAGLARDLRLLVRERLVAGDTDEQTVGFIVDRYGEYVLLKPVFSGSNIFLWAAGPLMFLIAAGVGYGYIRRRKMTETEELSVDEAARLAELLKN